jgi:hypothetical protein
MKEPKKGTQDQQQVEGCEQSQFVGSLDVCSLGHCQGYRGKPTDPQVTLLLA